MSKDKQPDRDSERLTEPNAQPDGKKGSFIQNMDQNNQIHKEALGRNAKR